MRPAAGLLAVALSAVAVGACGDSAQEKARSSVCDARADISKQVDTLKGMTVTTATVDDISTSLKAIRDDLSKIRDAQGQLSEERRQQVKDANAAFGDQVTSTVKDLGNSLSVADASAQITSALQQLATAYSQTVQRIDC